MIKLSPDISAILGEQPFDTLMTLRGDVYRQQGDRETVRLVIDQTPYFIKRYRRDFLTPGAKPEWEALRLCEQLGVNVPALKGFGTRGMKSFVLMEALVDAESLESVALTWSEKIKVTTQLALMTKKLHEQGYFHRDLYVCHFFWHHNAEKLTLIDLHRLFKPVLLKRHYQEKDLSALLFSVLDMPIQQRDVFRFLKHYFNLPLHEIFKKHAALLKSCEKKAIALYKKAYHQKPRHISWLMRRADWPDHVGEFHHQFNIDGKLLVSDTCLRVLGQRRAVLAGMMGNERVVVKLFSEKRAYEKEKNASTQGAFVGSISSGQRDNHFFITYPYIVGHAPKQLSPDLLKTISDLHNNGLIQTDPHLDNFRISGDKIYVLDPASIQSTHSENKLWDNLAQVYAQFPRSKDEENVKLLTAYVEARNKAWSASLPAMFKKRLNHAREYSLKKWLSKICRNSTAFYAKSRSYILIYAKRSFANVYTQTLMRFPDSYFQDNSVYLKQGRSNTVVRVTIGPNDVVIKRYNLKSLLHFLKGLFRGSKAKRAWRNTHLCLSLGIPTPEPLAMIEKRFLYIPLQSYLVTRFAMGIRLDHMDMKALTPDVCEKMSAAIKQAFDLFASVQCYHGDLKASNWIWDGEQMQLIDLDSLKHIRSKRMFEKYHQKDKARFLQNFDVTHPLHAMLL